MNKEAKLALKRYEDIETYLEGQLDTIRILKTTLLQRWVKDKINDAKGRKEE